MIVSSPRSIPTLIELKAHGKEKETTSMLPLFESEFERLFAMLESAAAESTLREEPEGRAGLHDLLVRLRG